MENKYAVGGDKQITGGDNNIALDVVKESLFLYWILIKRVWIIERKSRESSLSV